MPRCNRILRSELDRSHRSGQPFPRQVGSLPSRCHRQFGCPQPLRKSHRTFACLSRKHHHNWRDVNTFHTSAYWVELTDHIPQIHQRRLDRFGRCWRISGCKLSRKQMVSMIGGSHENHRSYHWVPSQQSVGLELGIKVFTSE